MKVRWTWKVLEWLMRVFKISSVKFKNGTEFDVF